MKCIYLLQNALALTVVNNNLCAATENLIHPSEAHGGDKEIHSEEYKKALKTETAKLSSTIRNLEKENVSLIEKKVNMEKTSKELQHDIADHNHTIENLWKLLSKAEDNLKGRNVRTQFLLIVRLQVFVLCSLRQMISL